MTTPRFRTRLESLSEYIPAMPTLPTLERRLARATNLDDLRRLARRRAPRMIFDYVDGGAEEERSLKTSVTAFDRVEYHPRALQDVSEVSGATEIFGREVSLPLVLGPTGFTRMMHHEGEAAVAMAAQEAGVPYVLSTMGSTTAAGIAAAAPAGWNWFQLYVVRDRALNNERLELARAAGMDVLVLTVDTPVAGARLRDVRHGMTIPPSLRWGSALQAVRHPRWWSRFVMSEPLNFAAAGGASDDLAGIVRTLFDPNITFRDVEWVRDRWEGRLLVKGVQDTGDAKELAALGVDGIVVSNHGGRQLDRTPAPLELLPDIRTAVGDKTGVYLDGGVRSGSDLAAAVALGADASFVGRAYLYGLMAGGQKGVDRMLALFREDYVRTLQLLGLSSTAEIDRGVASIRKW